jgi:hypothetical protein
MMAKIKATAEEIRLEIKRRIEGSHGWDGDCKDCRAPTPRFTDPGTNHGCNWTIAVFPGVLPGCLEFVKNVTQTVMAEYELSDF